ncbi:MAG: SprB repeat-containing protein, partial [Bacteroidota bacterium]
LIFEISEINNTSSIPVLINDVSCWYEIEPYTNIPDTFSYSGSNGYYRIHTEAYCNWTVTENVPWFYMDTQNSNTGTQTEFINVEPNTTPFFRLDTFFIEGEPMIVYQEGAPCEVLQATQPFITIDNVQDQSCGQADGSIDISVTGGTAGYTYYWSNGETTEDLSNLQGGNYTLFVEDGLGCSSNLISVDVSETSPGISVIAEVENANCGFISGSIDLLVSGGTPPYSFHWSNSPETTSSITGLFEGNYAVTITDAAACTYFDQYTVLPQISMYLEPHETHLFLDCEYSSDGIATANPTGGTPPYTYLWSNGATTNTISGLGPGAYTVSVTDIYDCYPVSAFYFVNVDSVDIVSDVTHVNCFGDSSGVINNTIYSLNTFDFTYLWSNGATDLSLSNLPAGDYSLTATSALGCEEYSFVQVLGPPSLLGGTIALDTIPDCPGEHNGQITAHPTGGAPPYTYQWSNNQTTASISGLYPGYYYLTVEDALGCWLNDQITVPGYNGMYLENYYGNFRLDCEYS